MIDLEAAGFVATSANAFSQWHAVIQCHSSKPDLDHRSAPSAAGFFQEIQTNPSALTVKQKNLHQNTWPCFQHNRLEVNNKSESVYKVFLPKLS